MAELADALDLGSSAARRGGSTPLVRTKMTTKYNEGFFASIEERRNSQEKMYFICTSREVNDE